MCVCVFEKEPSNAYSRAKPCQFGRRAEQARQRQLRAAKVSGGSSKRAEKPPFVFSLEASSSSNSSCRESCHSQLTSDSQSSSQEITDTNAPFETRASSLPLKLMNNISNDHIAYARAYCMSPQIVVKMKRVREMLLRGTDRRDASAAQHQNSSTPLALASRT